METIFLACFAIGLLFTVASVVLGFVGGGIGHAGVHVGHAAHAGHIGHAAPAGHAGHAAHPVGGHDGHDMSHAAGLPLLNASSALGALTWFGAAGYLLTRLGNWAVPLVLLGAIAVAALGWYLVARFLQLILKGEVEMDPDDYRLEGTVGRITVGIPEGGTGEIVFTKAGLTRSEAARALGGAAIGRGVEVVITSYAGGFAKVQPWNEFVEEREKLPSATERARREG